MKNITFYIVASIFYLFTIFPSSAQLMHGTPRDFENDPRIIGGKLALIEHWPGQVVIRSIGEGIATYGCGGTLISDRAVLTAAHCVTNLSEANNKRFYAGGDEVEVVIGIQNLNNVPDENIRKISRIVIHKQYKKVHTGNDIAIMFLNKPWQQGFMTLSETGKSDPTLHWDTPVLVAGYGLQKDNSDPISFTDKKNKTFYAGSDKLLEAVIPLTPPAICQESYKKSVKISPDQICAGPTKGGRDACKGDSGGPLVAFDRRGYPYQIGIVSWGKGCAQAEAYGLYTRISHHSEWIKKHVPDAQFLKLENVPQITANRNILIERLFAQLNQELGGINNKTKISVDPGEKLKLGDIAKFKINSPVTGQLILIDINAKGEITQIYPNPFSKNNKIEANKELTLPDKGTFEIEAQLPAGVSKVIALVTPADFNMEALNKSKGVDHTKGLSVRAALPYFQNLLNLIRITRGTDIVDQERGLVVKQAKQKQNWALGFYDYEITE